MKTVGMEAIEKARAMFEKQAPPPGAGKQEGTLDVETYLAHYGREIVGVKQNGASTLYCLKECIFDPAHSPNEAHIGQTPDGKLYYKCFHNSCQGRTWQEARGRISGTDKLTPFLLLSNSPHIYSLDNKDRETIKDYQGSTEGGTQTALDSKNGQNFDPFSVLRKGSELMTLDIKVTWVIDKLIPEQSITLLHGRGGIGKTWITLGIAHHVSQGIPFMGLETAKLPVVFVDYENSFPVLVERVKKIQATDVLFWHNTNEMRPPKLDDDTWEYYKRLPPGLLIYDTLRASQTKDENDSKQMAFVMSRLKELRDIGFTILLLHHTPKGNETTYKGSTAILDLADHVLSLHKVRRGSNEEIDEDESEAPCYRFGTKSKTRYEPFHLFLEFNKEQGFIVAPDPDTQELEEIYDLLKVEPEPLKQSQVFELVKTKLAMTSKGKVVKLLNKGTGKYWDTKRDEGKGRAIRYCPIVPIYIPGQLDSKDKSTTSSTYEMQGPQPTWTVTEGIENNTLLSREERTMSDMDTTKIVDNTTLSNCPRDNWTERTETPSQCPPDLDPVVYADGVADFMKGGKEESAAHTLTVEILRSLPTRRLSREGGA